MPSYLISKSQSGSEKGAPPADASIGLGLRRGVPGDGASNRPRVSLSRAVRELGSPRSDTVRPDRMEPGKASTGSAPASDSFLLNSSHSLPPPPMRTSIHTPRSL